MDVFDVETGSVDLSNCAWKLVASPTHANGPLLEFKGYMHQGCVPQNPVSTFSTNDEEYKHRFSLCI
jgi:hypothetical protein